MKKGYLTLIKENKENNVFLNRYTYDKDVKVGDELVFKDGVLVCNNTEDTLRSITSENWNNLQFLYTGIIGDAKSVDSDYYNSDVYYTKKIKVLKILTKEDIFKKIRENVNNNVSYSFSRYIKAIKLSNEENNILINMILANLSGDFNGLLAPIAYYQYKDLDAFKKANSKPSKPIILPKNK